jgi:hypothetical protein
MEVNVQQLEEMHDVALWQAPPVIAVPDGLHASLMAAAASTTDKAVGHTYSTDQSGLPPLGNELQEFGQWPSVASSIWNKLIKMTGFNPGDEVFNQDRFSAFRSKFASCPFWNGLDFNITTREGKLRIRDYRAAVNAIIDLVSVAVDASKRDEILSGIKKVAELASQKGSQAQKQTSFQNGLLHISRGRLYVFFLYNNVRMERRQGKFHVAIEQDFKVVRAYGVLDFDFCKRHASDIKAWDKRAVDDWVGDSAASHVPENTSEGWPPD